VTERPQNRSVATRGRTLDHAALVYDWCEPIIMLGQQEPYNRDIVNLLELESSHHVLDLGCGTGLLTRLIADGLDAYSGGFCLGIDAASKMIAVARKKRSSPACLFEVMAAEELFLEDCSFDSIVSSLFFHHVPLDLKKRSLAEAFRVLKPGGRLVIADMNTPTTFKGALVSHIARWFFLQPEIGENIAGVLPQLVLQTGFTSPSVFKIYFGYIALFISTKPT
jgi:ubiquinone/menaquinone biosynthesis C-methylase UbiE